MRKIGGKSINKVNARTYFTKDLSSQQYQFLRQVKDKDLIWVFGYSQEKNEIQFIFDGTGLYGKEG